MKTCYRRTKQQTDGTTNAAVTSGNDDLPTLELTSRLVRFSVRGDVVDGRGVEPPLLSRERLLALRRWEEPFLEFFWNLLRGHASSEDCR